MRRWRPQRERHWETGQLRACPLRASAAGPLHRHGQPLVRLPAPTESPPAPPRRRPPPSCWRPAAQQRGGSAPRSRQPPPPDIVSQSLRAAPPAATQQPPAVHPPLSPRRPSPPTLPAVSARGQPRDRLGGAAVPVALVRRRRRQLRQRRRGITTCREVILPPPLTCPPRRRPQQSPRPPKRAPPVVVCLSFTIPARRPTKGSSPVTTAGADPAASPAWRPTAVLPGGWSLIIGLMMEGMIPPRRAQDEAAQQLRTDDTTIVIDVPVKNHTVLAGEGVRASKWQSPGPEPGRGQGFVCGAGTLSMERGADVGRGRTVPVSTSDMLSLCLLLQSS